MPIYFPEYAEKSLHKDGFFFIAEVSNNHLGDLERFKRIILAAKEFGAHAVKIQTYSANSLCLPQGREKHQIRSGPWAGQSYWDLYKSMEIPRSWSLEVRDFAESIGIPIFSSPFSATDVKFLAQNGFSMLKVASGEFACPELIDSIIASKVKFMASTGFADEYELNWLKQRLNHSNSIDQLWCLFNCVSNYPSGVEELNMSKFDLINKYTDKVGLSDHSIDNSSVLISLLANARVFEKHLTLNRADGGPDAFFSLEPTELRTHIKLIKSVLANPTLKSARLNVQSSNGTGRAKLKFSRSLYAKAYIKKGAVITLDNVGSFRPAHHESSIMLDQLLGKTVRDEVSPGDPIFSSNVI